jgi:hypothetical protein
MVGKSPPNPFRRGFPSLRVGQIGRWGQIRKALVKAERLDPTFDGYFGLGGVFSGPERGKNFGFSRGFGPQRTFLAHLPADRCAKRDNRMRDRIPLYESFRNHPVLSQMEARKGLFRQFKVRPLLSPGSPTRGLSTCTCLVLRHSVRCRELPHADVAFLDRWPRRRRAPAPPASSAT